MKTVADLEYPEDVERKYRKARRLEWWTLAYVASTSFLLYVTMGTSQAMRASFFEDLISFVPSAAFLVGTSLAVRSPSRTWPYGLHGASSVAYLTASLGLLAMGTFLVAESVAKLVSGEKTTIGGMELFGSVVWAGWPMLAAILWGAVPNAFLAKAKLRLAPALHDKALYADAKMMKANWMTAAATAVGVLGAGFGLSWLDPVAAIFVGLDVLKDGAGNLRTAVADLIDRRPRKVDQSDWSRLPDDVLSLLRALPWVEDAAVRMREEGHIYFGEAFVVPRPGTTDLVEKLSAAAEGARALDWRMHELTIMPVRDLERRGERDQGEPAAEPPSTTRFRFASPFS